MKEIVLAGTVGDLWWDETCISAKRVREAFSEINDTQVRITIDSMGGDFFEMITIFNIIQIKGKWKICNNVFKSIITCFDF